MSEGVRESSRVERVDRVEGMDWTDRVRPSGQGMGGCGIDERVADI